MEALQDAYYGVLDAYHVISPWLPIQLRASMQSLYSQSLTIFHTLLTDPAALSEMVPQIISTLLLFISVWWTLSSVYHTARRTFRILYFLFRYGTIAAVLLSGLGYLSTDSPRSDVTLSGSILEGVHTVMDYFDLELPGDVLGAFVPHLDLQPRAPAPPHGPRKPWERFANLANDSPASNTRAKAKSASKKARRRRGDEETANPLGDISMADALRWFGELRKSPPFGSAGAGDEEGSEQSAFERKVRQIWEGRDAYRSVDDFLNAFKSQSPDGAGGKESEEPFESTSESR